ncbi:MAG TPA: aminotransferase class I/II-fold pyridoxal phosphate-dependent enzyme [Kofleriaceae bacterium]|nr:aminotransferase class I/II-fold pyridoxal phosphate-dependent enzyme [Kofleriaceae bacterium]
MISLAGCLPAEELSPRGELVRAMEHVLESAAWNDCLDHIRAWIADRLSARGALVDPSDVIVTAGARPALAIAARALRPAGRVAVGELTSPAAIAAFTGAGHEVVPVDEAAPQFLMEGVGTPDGIDRVASRRAELLASGVPLVIDDSLVDLRFDGVVPRALLADAPDRVWQVGSLTKVMCAGLGIGWLVPPRHALRDAVALARKDELCDTGLVPAAVARILHECAHPDRVARARANYAERARAVVDAIHHHLPGWQVLEPEGGLAVWAESDLEGDDVDVVMTAINQGVAIDPGCVFRPDGQGTPLGFRISFAHTRTVDLEEGIRRLARAARKYRRCDPDN